MTKCVVATLLVTSFPIALRISNRYRTPWVHNIPSTATTSILPLGSSPVNLTSTTHKTFPTPPPRLEPLINHPERFRLKHYPPSTKPPIHPSSHITSISPPTPFPPPLLLLTFPSPFPFPPLLSPSNPSPVRRNLNLVTDSESESDGNNDERDAGEDERC